MFERKLKDHKRICYIYDNNRMNQVLTKLEMSELSNKHMEDSLVLYGWAKSYYEEGKFYGNVGTVTNAT